MSLVSLFRFRFLNIAVLGELLQVFADSLSPGLQPPCAHEFLSNEVAEP
jgi:hypothetical protein